MNICVLIGEARILLWGGSGDGREAVTIALACFLCCTFSSRSSRSPLLDEDEQPPPPKNIKLRLRDNAKTVTLIALYNARSNLTQEISIWGVLIMYVNAERDDHYQKNAQTLKS